MKGLFLDRDGVINEDFGYVYKIEDFKFKEGIFKVLKKAMDKEYKIFIITNQSGISRGYYTENDFLKLMNWVQEQFLKKEIKITDIAFCPHHPDDNCDCRKPKPKMILDLIKKYNIDPSKSIMVGDKDSDVEAGKNANIATNIKINDSILEIIDLL